MRVPLKPPGGDAGVAPPAAEPFVKIYATGVRNAYDLVFTGASAAQGS
jgi:hypothetical protein